MPSIFLKNTQEVQTTLSSSITLFPESHLPIVPLDVQIPFKLHIHHEKMVAMRKHHTELYYYIKSRFYQRMTCN